MGSRVWCLISLCFFVSCYFQTTLAIGEPAKYKAQLYSMWLKENGFVTDNLSIELDPSRGGYGVFSTRDIMKGEEIIRIPQNLVLNRKSIIRRLSETLEDTESPKFARISSFRAALVELDTLSNHTNNDAHMMSFWTLYEMCFPEILEYKAWVDILPPKVDNLIHFEEDEIRHLEGSEVYDRANTLKIKTEHFWKDSVSKVASELFERDGVEENWEDCFSLTKWKWAMSIVSSRATFVPEQGLSIVHMAEMFNHKTMNQRHRPEKYIDDNGDFVIVSQQIYAKNTQIFFDYLQPNSELLLRYGFLDERCKHDSVGLPFGLNPDDKWYDEKAAILTENGWQLVVYFPLEIQPSKEFMFYLRLFSANEEELEILREDTMAYFHKRISDRNEKAACSLMEKIALSLLSQYTEQDLHPDEEAKVRKTLSPRAEMAFDLAKIERRILKSMIDFSQSLFPTEDTPAVGPRSPQELQEQQEALLENSMVLDV